MVPHWCMLRHGNWWFARLLNCQLLNLCIHACISHPYIRVAFPKKSDQIDSRGNFWNDLFWCLLVSRLVRSDNTAIAALSNASTQWDLSFVLNIAYIRAFVTVVAIGPICTNHLSYIVGNPEGIKLIFPNAQQHPIVYFLYQDMSSFLIISLVLHLVERTEVDGFFMLVGSYKYNDFWKWGICMRID